MPTAPETSPATSATSLPPLTPLEICSGMIFGAEPELAEEDDDEAVRSGPRAALEEVLLPALTRPPCLVAFSGGRDSSAILAAATDVARRRGLDDPVPVTYRYEAHPKTWEPEWQEAVVRHLDLAEWVTKAVTIEFDAVGELAAGMLRRHGLFWPPNAHAMVPLLRAAQGGSLVTGNGGDELFTPRGSRRVVPIRTGRLRPARGEVKHVVLSVLSVMPRAVRELAWRARRPVRLPWLGPEGSRQLARAVAARWAEQSRSWAEAVEATIRHRNLRVAQAAFHTFARDADCALVEPLLDRRFVVAVGGNAPRRGYESRAAALEAHFGDLLPRATITRSTKASFTEVFWGPASRAFAARWDGAGLDAGLVDAQALRREWSKPTPDFRSVTALQAAWLATNAQA